MLWKYFIRMICWCFSDDVVVGININLDIDVYVYVDDNVDLHFVVCACFDVDVEVCSLFLNWSFDFVSMYEARCWSSEVCSWYLPSWTLFLIFAADWLVHKNWSVEDGVADAEHGGWLAGAGRHCGVAAEQHQSSVWQFLCFCFLCCLCFCLLCLCCCVCFVFGALWCCSCTSLEECLAIFVFTFLVFLLFVFFCLFFVWCVLWCCSSTSLEQCLAVFVFVFLVFFCFCVFVVCVCSVYGAHCGVAAAQLWSSVWQTRSKKRLPGPERLGLYSLPSLLPTARFQEQPKGWILCVLTSSDNYDSSWFWPTFLTTRVDRMEMLVNLRTALPSSHHRAPNVIMLVGKTSGVTWCQRLGRWASLSLSLCNLLPLSLQSLTLWGSPSLPFSPSLTLSDSPSFVPSLNFHPPSTQLTSHATVKLLISRRAYFPSFAESSCLAKLSPCPLFGEDAPSSNSMNL